MKEKTDLQLINCGFVKTILMLIVIFGHSIAFWTGTWIDIDVANQNPILGYCYSYVNSFHIYAFVLVSGYIFAFKILEGGYDKYILFLSGKAKRLLIPYIFVMAIWVAPISAILFNWEIGFLAKKYLLAIDPSQLWFLWMLFWVFLIVWPMRKMLLGKPMLGWGIAIVSYGIGVAGKYMLPNVFCIWTAFQYIPFFFIGMRIRKKEEKGKKLITQKVPVYVWIILDIVFFVITKMVRFQNGIVWNSFTIGFNFILHILGAIMAWVTLQAIAKIVAWRRSLLFNKVSSCSMPMYLFHQQIIYFSIFMLNGKVNSWINAAINFLVASLGSFVISLFLMKWKITRFLIGEK